MPQLTPDDVARELLTVVSHSSARAMLGRASRVARVRRDAPLAQHELLMLLEALAAEGGDVQRIAEGLARRALG